MAKFAKRLIESKRNYSGTGILSKLSFSGKFYLALFLLLVGIFSQCFLILSCFFEYRTELNKINSDQETVDNGIKTLREVSWNIFQKYNSGSDSDVSGDLNRLNQTLGEIKDRADENALQATINRVETAIDQFGAFAAPVTSEASQAFNKLYRQYNEEINSLAESLRGHFKQNYQDMLVFLLLRFGTVFGILGLIVLICRWIVKCAFISINEPADRISQFLKRTNNGGLYTKLPILASEGLGVVGLILNDGISRRQELAMELKNAGNKLNYLIEELISGFGQVFLLEAQLQAVYQEIEDNFNEQNRMVIKANQEITTLISDLFGLQNIPRKVSKISEELNSIITVTKEHLGGALYKSDEIDNNESQDIMKILRDFSITSEQVDRITKELDEIEEESEMLAFNSAISAARAGAEGEGFSVVAKEIANLVERSKQASNVLGGLMGQIQERTVQIVKFIPNHDLVSKNELQASQAINTIFTNLGKTAVDCEGYLNKMRQVVEIIIEKCNEAFEEVDSISDLPQVDVGQLSGIKNEMARYLESIKHTEKVAGRIFATVNNLQSATDLLIGRNN